MRAESTGFRGFGHGGSGVLPIQSGKRSDARHIHVRFEKISDSIESGAAISVRIVRHAHVERREPFRFTHGVDEVAAKTSGIEQSVNRATNDPAVLRMRALEVI